MSRFLRLVLAAGIAAGSVDVARAATATATMRVSMTIQAQCSITTPSPALAFPASGVLTTNMDATTTLGVQCTAGTPYTIGIDAGLGGGSVAQRKMRSGSGAGAATIDYGLFRDAARSQVWGNTPGTDTAAGTGTGAAQSLMVYGRVAAQNTPAAGLYTDDVTITLTY
ncbi:MAG: SCPU domain-containing protein [Hyphomicrobiales bacterium]|nr:MAG: SCPU domain-containing protein [Hyphomicrobiales bacterium]